MHKTDPYGITTPCDSCPFRNDIDPFLTYDRVREIEYALQRGEFPCHKTVDYDSEDEDGDETSTENAKHCAGALILLEKLNRPSQMMRICERVGLYDRSKLNMDAPVFKSFDEMAKAQERRRLKRKKKGP